MRIPIWCSLYYYGSVGYYKNVTIRVWKKVRILNCDSDIFYSDRESQNNIGGVTRHYTWIFPALFQNIYSKIIPLESSTGNEIIPALGNNNCSQRNNNKKQKQLFRNNKKSLFRNISKWCGKIVSSGTKSPSFLNTAAKSFHREWKIYHSRRNNCSQRNNDKKIIVSEQW